MAATWRSPAAAGLPLLTAYLITAANGEAALALRYFVVPVVLWLVMLHTTARAQFGRWGTANAADRQRDRRGRARPGRPALLHRRGAQARRHRRRRRRDRPGRHPPLPAALPHRGARAHRRRRRRGLGRLQRHPRPSRSLNNQDQSPVLTYTTTAFTRAPLRVLATSYYSRGQWSIAARPVPPRQPAAAAAAGQATRLRHHRLGQHPGRAAHRRALPRRRRGDGRHAVDDRPRHARRARGPRREQLPRHVRRPGTVTTPAA